MDIKFVTFSLLLIYASILNIFLFIRRSEKSLSILTFYNKFYFPETKNQVSSDITDKFSPVSKNYGPLQEKSHQNLIPKNISENQPSEAQKKKDENDLVNKLNDFFNKNQNISFPYNYMIQNTIVCDPKPYILVIAPSAPSEFLKRDIIRTIWGAKKWKLFAKTQLLFLLGNSTNENNAKILNESKIHQDLIQLDFLDTYNNLTVKMLSGFRWIDHHCPNVDWVVKCDTDVFVNTISLIRFLKYYDRKTKHKRTEILCRKKPSNQLEPIRNSTKYEKWNVETDEYPFDTYPPHCNGPAYIIPRNLIPHLYSAADKLHPFRMEDVYYTGIVPKLTNITIDIKNVKGLFNWRPKKITKNISLSPFIFEAEKMLGLKSWKKIWEIIKLGLRKEAKKYKLKPK